MCDLFSIAHDHLWVFNDSRREWSSVFCIVPSPLPSQLKTITVCMVVLIRMIPKAHIIYLNSWSLVEQFGEGLGGVALL